MKAEHVAALGEIKERHPKKLLMPASVVLAAKRPNHPLHKKFQWEDSVAAREYRLWQARELIAQFWTIEQRTQQPIRMWISMKSDRRAGGYRDHKDVLANPKHRREWLQMALADLSEWERTYGALTELAPVFKALAKLRANM